LILRRDKKEAKDGKNMDTNQGFDKITHELVLTIQDTSIFSIQFSD
jgi:hypothetical protein